MAGESMAPSKYAAPQQRIPKSRSRAAGVGRLAAPRTLALHELAAASARSALAATKTSKKLYDQRPRTAQSEYDR